MKFINFKTTCMIYTLINFSFGLLSMLVSDRVLNFIGLESTNSTELLIKNIGSFFISLSLLSILTGFTENIVQKYLASANLSCISTIIFATNIYNYFFGNITLISILLSIFYGLFTFLFFGISYYNYNLIEHHQFT